jgi:hypothetical protein
MIKQEGLNLDLTLIAWDCILIFVFLTLMIIEQYEIDKY